MAITNTAAFAQYRRMYNTNVSTANGGTLAAPTNTALLTVAGPDGALITKAAAIPRDTVENLQAQLFLSKDGGATFGLIAATQVAAATVSISSSVTPVAFAQIDGGVIGETNPIPLSGVTTFDSVTPTDAGVTLGSANAQTLPFATSITALTAGLIIDFEAGFTNTTSTTLTVGTAPAASIVRDASGAALSAGDLTTGFRYRARCDGTFWRLFMTDRLYVAIGKANATGIAFVAEQADF